MTFDRHCTALIGSLWFIGGLANGLAAQTAPVVEKPSASRMRESSIREAELSDGSDPAAGRDEEQGPASGQDSEPGARANVTVFGEESGEPGADGMRDTGQGADALPLLGKITAKTSPQRAASLKLVDEGRTLLGTGEYKQALAAFERAIAVDATNPYSHYFLARAHFFLGNYPESFNFLDVSESLLGWHKLWLGEIYVLKGRNATAMGFLGRADTNYLQALAFDPYNRFAIESLTIINGMADQALATGP